MRATRGLRFLPPTPHEPAVLFLLLLVWYGHGMARHGALDHGGIGHGMRRPGLAWPGGSLTLADSFTRTQREKWDGLH